MRVSKRLQIRLGHRQEEIQLLKSLKLVILRKYKNLSSKNLFNSQKDIVNNKQGGSAMCVRT